MCPADMDIQEILSTFRPSRDDLIPILQAVQNELGYLPPEAMKQISDYTRVPESQVFGVASFYAFFKFEPSGKHTIRVCRGTACHVRGGARVLREIVKNLGVQPGKTTDDLEFTLETVACIGACALAPTMVIDGETYGQMTPSKAMEIIRSIKEKG